MPTTRRALRGFVAALVGAIASFAPAGPARAKPPATTHLPLADEPDPAFVYETPFEADPYRASFEQFIILSVGYAQYGLNKNANQRDWTVGTNWDGIKRKLRLEASAFDDNHFDTNWLAHPAAGFFYYGAARGNRLGVMSSLAMSFSTSFLWEMFGEVREATSWNDVIATPTTGAVLAESFLQVGALMHRSRKTPLTVSAGWLFAPFKSAHDAFDGLTPRKADRFDHLGFADDVWHRFTVGAGGGVTHQSGSPRTESDARGWFASEIVTIPGYRREGRGGRSFDSAEVTSFRLQFAGASARFVDFGVRAAMLPAGYFWHDASRDGAGALRGHGFLAGVRLETEYTRHDYDRGGTRSDDRIGLIALGATTEEIVHAGPATLRARLDVTGHFGGVMAYALAERRTIHGDVGLTSVLRDEGYYHSYGGTVRPSLDVEIGLFDLGGTVQFDAFRAIEGVDVYGYLPGEVSASDRRVHARAAVGARLLRHVRAFVQVERNERRGSVASQHAARTELGLYGGAEVVF